MEGRDISNHIHSFSPIIDERSEVLILGTIPGPESLRKQQYYANPNNQFWNIIFSVFGMDKPDSSYDNKVRFLLEHRIALWDVYYSADRSGAMDADIKNPKLNDIYGLVLAHPRIKCILLAGRTAERAFRKHFTDISVDAFYVPSASSAYARIQINEKINYWKNAISMTIL